MSRVMLLGAASFTAALLACGAEAVASDLASPAAPSSEPHDRTLENAMPRTLIVYYSRTGTTEKLAKAIQRETGADIEALVDNVDRRGVGGFMRSLVDAVRKREAPLAPMQHDPARYELVVIGTPDWGKSVSAPVRTFLAAQRGRLPSVAFFLTDGEEDHALVFRDMAALAGREPLATLGVAHDDVLQDRFADRMKEFVRALARRSQEDTDYEIAHATAP